MKIFKKYSQAQALCNCANRFPWFNVVVKEVPGGWIITKANDVKAA